MFPSVNIPEIAKVSIGSLIFSIFLSYLLGYCLAFFYKKQANSLSNHESLSNIFPLLTVTVTLVIAVVKSSLALSLGLVGALSIVRFRTPIKEPEELTYIFLCIGIGLATGSDQYLVAIVGFSLTLLCIFINKKLTSKSSYQNNLSLSITGIETSDISKVIELISKNSLYVNFHSLSISKGTSKNTNLNLSFTPKEFKNLNLLVEEISNLFPLSSINIIDNKIY